MNEMLLIWSSEFWRFLSNDCICELFKSQIYDLLVRFYRFDNVII